jgi:hypothetical protein
LHGDWAVVERLEDRLLRQRGDGDQRDEGDEDVS